MPVKFLKEVKGELPNFMWISITYSGSRSKTKTNKKGRKSIHRGFYTDKDMETVWNAVEQAIEKL